jgi:hypothetical protein
MEVANPSSQDRTLPWRYRVGRAVRRSALRPERFSAMNPKETWSLIHAATIFRRATTRPSRTEVVLL